MQPNFLMYQENPNWLNIFTPTIVVFDYLFYYIQDEVIHEVFHCIHLWSVWINAWVCFRFTSAQDVHCSTLFTDLCTLKYPFYYISKTILEVFLNMMKWIFYDLGMISFLTYSKTWNWWFWRIWLNCGYKLINLSKYLTSFTNLIGW